MNILHEAAEKGDDAAIHKIIKKNPIYLNKIDGSRRSELHYAAKKGHLSTIRILLAYGSDPTLKDDSGIMPIYYAIVYNHIECVIEFLSKENSKIYINDCDDQKYTLLHYAALYSNIRCVRLILEFGVDKTKKTTYNQIASDIARNLAIQKLIEDYEDIPYCKHCLQ